MNDYEYYHRLCEIELNLMVYVDTKDKARRDRIFEIISKTKKKILTQAKKEEMKLTSVVISKDFVVDIEDVFDMLEDEDRAAFIQEKFNDLYNSQKVDAIVYMFSSLTEQQQDETMRVLNKVRLSDSCKTE